MLSKVLFNRPNSSRRLTLDLVRAKAMSTELDPHHLVALMCHVGANTQDGCPYHSDTSSQYFKYAIVDNNKTSVRTSPIQDAIANICVSQEKSQIIAVAIQVDSEQRGIRLTIAENGTVTDSLLNYLKNVSKDLQTLSRENANQRVGVSDLPGHEQHSSAIPMGVALGLKKIGRAHV